MDVFSAADVLRTHLATNQSALGGLPIVHPNTIQPSVTSHPGGFVYVAVGSESGSQITIGSPGDRTFRDDCAFAVTVCVPRGSAVGTAEGIARAIRELFKPENFAGLNLHIRKRSLLDGRVGGKDGAWWLQPVVIEFVTDQIE